ncbi:MAG TPA: MarR family transcriptional regulator [Egicoccus sp.]|nr:MarR family transcriptional regulator [Egicoccus sp.]HSK24332.1 MarR family transcriptional regulator [Egicoccus sp.]
MEEHLHDADESSEVVSEAIVALLHAFGTQMHAVGSRFAAREDLHPTDLQALSRLAQAAGPMTAGDLARSLELSTGATTRLVDRLERMGHVERTTDDDDRRRRRIAVSPRARATAGGYFGELSRRIERIIDTMDAPDRDIVAAFLAALVATMETPAVPDDEDAPAAPDGNGPASA